MNESTSNDNTITTRLHNINEILREQNEELSVKRTPEESKENSLTPIKHNPIQQSRFSFGPA